MTEDEVKNIEKRYLNAFEGLFLPEDPISNDIVKYFASILRVVGMEDKGWDPHLESRGILEDINKILQLENKEDTFENADYTTWRFGLLMYSHIVEMDAPYEVIANLLRCKLGKGYRPDPYREFLNRQEKKNFKNKPLFPRQKIKVIKKLAEDASSPIGDIIDEFYDPQLRNSISHSDFIITDDEFRSRSGSGARRAYKINLSDLNIKISKAKIFISAFFALDSAARIHWGNHKGKALVYDSAYKGMMEILVDDNNLMCGFKVHWPNNSESVYRRTPDGIEMTNTMLDLSRSTVDFFVGLYARDPGSFSPLVEKGSEPKYTPLEITGEVPVWHQPPNK